MRATGNVLFDRLLGPRAEDERDFLRLPGGGALSYRATAERAFRMAGALAELGVAPGDRVLVQAPKSVDALCLYLGTAIAGGVFLPLNTAYTAREAAYFAGDAEPKVMICAPGDAAALAPVAASCGARLLTLGAEGEDAADETAFAIRATAAAPLSAPAPRAPDDLAAILYTSGTTGRSKGAMLSAENLLSNADTLRQVWRFTEADVLLHALPIFHTHGLFVGTNISLLAGGSMIFLPKFDPDAVIGALPDATTMMGVPTFYTRLLADPRFDRAATAGMRLFISGSAPLLAETHRAFEARTGHRILERYGMTETNMNTSNPYEGERRPGSVGPALPGVDLRVVDAETGAALPDGETGVLHVRGPNVFQGYWRMPEKTAEELLPDGYFITGDLGLRDADGYVTIVGRAKDLIISGGLNIYPKEVEEVIDALPGVHESAVIGVPHPDFGEAVVAYVTREAGSNATAEAIGSALAPLLAKFKQPKMILFLDALPRNTMGKVQKQRLRDEAKGLFQSA